MVVQHNMQAANANRMLGITVNSQQKSTEKLSSGYKINRAADDAAGLAISEKMRSQIRGLDKASTNAQDGISVVQTAEGALNEVHSMLQRMNELATQAANDTNTSQDRSQIQLEVSQLTQEINRVSSTTQFNTQNLLDGTFTSRNLQVGALSGQRIELSISKMSADGIGVSQGLTQLSGTVKDGTTDGTYKFIAKNTKVTGETANGKTGTATITEDGWYKLTQNGNVSSKGVADDGTVTLSEKVGKSDLAVGDNDGTEAAGNKITISNGQATLDNSLQVDSFEHAGEAMDKIQKAIDRVSTQRASLGAVQNRLEHTIANLDNVSENTQSAESRIRDTDMAKEMVSWSKNNILQQAGQSMLAQANQSNQGVLSLLQ